MNESNSNSSNLIDTTDSLEAVGVFKGWKNFFFVIIILCLLVLQAAFWVVNTGYIKTDEPAPAADPTAATTEPAEEAEKIEAPNPTEPSEAEPPTQAAAEPNELQKAAQQVTTDSNEPAPRRKPLRFSLRMKIEHITSLIRFFNFLLIPTAILYCLTMLFSLKVSLLGRLGGINHISRAFFLSLTFVVLLLPWQRFFSGVVAGAIYTPAELLTACKRITEDGLFYKILHYLRFTGYWLLVSLILIFSQLASRRWARAILRRLEII